MAEEVISKERMNYTINLLIAMAVEEIAEDVYGRNPRRFNTTAT